MVTTQLTRFTTSDRVLCVCQFGESRSVALARFLHSKGIPAVACGWDTAGRDFIDALIWQSTKIVTLQKNYLGKILYAYGLPAGSNCIHFDVGQCPWVNTQNPGIDDLLAKMFFSYQRNPRPHVTLADVGIKLQ